MRRFLDRRVLELFVLIVCSQFVSSSTLGSSLLHHRLSSVLEQSGDERTVVVVHVSTLSKKGTLPQSLYDLSSNDNDSETGPGVSSSSSVVAIDCSRDGCTSRDKNIAIEVADVIVCDVAFEDVMRGDAGFSALQPLLENLLYSHPNGDLLPKQLFVTCSGCTVDDLKSMEAQLTRGVEAMLENIPKPVGMEGSSVFEYFDVCVSALPHHRYASQAFADKVSSLKNQILASKVHASAASDIQDRLDEITEARGEERVENSLDLAATRSLFLCGNAMNVAFDEFCENLPELQRQLEGCALEDFGDICDAALDGSVETFDAEIELAGSAADLKRQELIGKIHLGLEPSYQAKLNQLDDASWDRLKKELVKLKLFDNLPKDMRASVKNTESYYRKMSRSMACKGSSWTSSHKRRQLIDTMSDFATERLQSMRLQGSYIPGMHRKPVAVGLHLLVKQPMHVIDSTRDILTPRDNFDHLPEYKIVPGFEGETVYVPEYIRSHTRQRGGRYSAYTDSRPGDAVDYGE